MYSSEIKRICLKSLEAVESFKPDFSKFDNGKDIYEHFHELYQADENFYQVFLSDKTEEIYVGERLSFVLDIDEKEEIEHAINLYNEKLAEMQKIVAIEELKENYLVKEYLYLSRVSSDYGLCHMKYLPRNKTIEEAREAEARKYHYEDVDCTSCGDGGCIHCEPHRFI